MMINSIKLTNEIEYPAGTCFCVGQNYAKHAAEMGSQVSSEPVIFLKPSQALVESGSTIELPNFSKNIHYEVELVVLIGRDAIDIDEKEACNYIAGYGIGIDLTLRDLQADAKSKGKPWTTAKGFRDSAPISDFIPKNKNIDNFFNIELKLNNETVQKSNTKEMNFSVEYLVSYLSKIFTLRKGDLIFTGTPEGVGSVKSGDTAEAYLNEEKMLLINFK